MAECCVAVVARIRGVLRLLQPPIDDRAIWDIWLSQYQLPVVLAADELGVFSLLDAAPLSFGAVVRALDLPERSVEILLTALAALRLLVLERGTYSLTELARTYL